MIEGSNCLQGLDARHQEESLCLLAERVAAGPHPVKAKPCHGNIVSQSRSFDLGNSEPLGR